MTIADATVGDPSPDHPLIVWVGDRPGLDEKETLVAWTGPAGRLLREHYVRPLPPAHHLLTDVLTTYMDAKPALSAYKNAFPDLTARITAAGSGAASERILVLMGANPCRYAHYLDTSFPTGIKKSLSHQARSILIGDQQWTVFFTYNPAHILEQPNLARAADNHHRLIRLHMTGRLATRSRPTFAPVRRPRTTDPRTISVDIETYGAISSFGTGRRAPSQKDTDHNGRFHPARSLYEDRPERLVVTASVTLPRTETADPRPLLLWDGTFPHGRESLMKMVPGTTITFNMERSDHRAAFASWLKHADTLIGHNILFDLQYLLFGEPTCRQYLRLFSKHLIDTGILAYLQDETRPEKSLKDLGPLLGLYLYEDSLRHRTYSTPSDPALHRYNGEDTHNTMMLAAGLAGMIDDEWTSIDKAQHECLAFYSRTIWSVLPMLERGVTFSIPKLLDLEAQTRATIDRCTSFCAEHDLKISGSGSKKSSIAFISSICDRVPDLINHELFKLTDKTKEISVSALNLKLCKYHLASEDPAHAILDAWLEEKKASKLLSSYIVPMLYASKNTLKYVEDEPSKLNRSSALIPEILPCSPSSSSASTRGSSGSTSLSPSETSLQTLLCPTEVGIAYPRVYVTPSSATDSSGDEGGTEQMRLVFKGPALQTNPPEIQACQTARTPDWHCWSMDLAQIEMRVPGLLSGDPKLIAAFESGLDLHTDKALSIFGQSFLEQKLNLAPGTPIDKSTPGFNDYRQVGKTDNFASQFWATAPTMQKTVFEDQMIYVPIDFFKKAVKSRPTSMPTFYQWQCATVKEGSDKGYLNLPLLGLSRHFVGGAEYHLNKLLNFKVQALAAAVLLDIQHRMAYRMSKTRSWFMTLNVYDAVKGECAPDAHSEVETALRESVDECWSRGVWGEYQSLYNRRVPLDYDLEFKDPSPPKR